MNLFISQHWDVTPQNDVLLGPLIGDPTLSLHPRQPYMAPMLLSRGDAAVKWGWFSCLVFCLVCPSIDHCPFPKEEHIQTAGAAFTMLMDGYTDLANVF